MRYSRGMLDSSRPPSPTADATERAEGAPGVIDHTVSFAHANVAGLVLLVLAFAVVLGAYVALWGLPSRESVRALTRAGWLATLLPWAVIGVSAVVHEALHAVGFRAFGGVPWRSIRFGVNWRLLTPFAGTSTPMSARAYRWAGALPGLVLGVAPAVAGLALGSGWLASYGAFMLGAAGGDAVALWAIRRVPSGARVRDSRHRVGCEVLARPDAGSASGAAA